MMAARTRTRTRFDISNRDSVAQQSELEPIWAFRNFTGTDASLMSQLEGEILQYESQLAQVQLALSELPEGDEKNDLCALEADLKEIINLSRGSLPKPKADDTSKSDPFAEEYSLFKAELDELDKDNNAKPEISKKTADELRQDLESLKGNKCQAPFTYKWTSDVTYYNAFVSHVPDPDELSDYDDIKVKVMFTNPTHKEMLPCPYYLEGECKFTDDKCRYSHGELVSLSSLKEYREPDFSRLSSGCKVFAKQDDELWYRAVVVSVGESQCNVKFESNSKEEEIPFHNILPLESTEELGDGNSSSDEDCSQGASVSRENEDDIVRRILMTPPGSALGEWERFTKGFGSKIMAKMGYVHGSGLGRNGMGRVEPVPAVILPAGKSLDHCMMLKEKAGNDKDLFKAERKMKILQKKHEAKLRKAYENESEKTDVFTFLNNTLHPSVSQKPSKTESKNLYKNESTRNLNVTSLQLAEEARRIEKEIKSLNQSLARHSPHTHAFNVIKEKLAFKESKLSQLHASEMRVKTEQNLRRDREKLTVF